MVLAIVGGITLVVAGNKVPDVLIGFGAASVGTLVGLLVSSSHSSADCNLGSNATTANVVLIHPYTIHCYCK